MEAEFYEHKRSGRDETICAWGIVLVLALLFGGLELLRPHASLKTSGFATFQSGLDSKPVEDIDQAGQSGFR
jgi:hypothetical protein